MKTTDNANLFSRLFDGLDDPNRLAIETHQGERITYGDLIARAGQFANVLVARGVDPTSLVVPEAGHLALRDAYESNLRGYASGQRSGIQSWLLYAAEAFTAGAEASPLRRSAL